MGLGLGLRFGGHPKGTRSVFLTIPQAGDITAWMPVDVECTHCRVVMTSWTVPGSPVRYYQCPFCARTHSSFYGEVFRHEAGARLLRTRPTAGGIPSASPEDIRWAGIKATAARWFARLDEEEKRAGPARATAPLPARRAVAVPARGPQRAVEVAPARARRR